MNTPGTQSASLIPLLTLVFSLIEVEVEEVMEVAEELETVSFPFSVEPERVTPLRSQ